MTRARFTMLVVAAATGLGLGCGRTQSMFGANDGGPTPPGDGRVDGNRDRGPDYIAPDYSLPDRSVPDYQRLDAPWPDYSMPDFEPPPPPFDATVDSQKLDYGLPDATPGYMPDLLITSFTHKVNNNNRVRYRLRVCNYGNAPAPSFYVDLYYNRGSAPGVQEYGDQYEQHPYLGAGNCIDITLNRQNTPPGKYESWAQVDADGAVDELFEGNNTAGPAYVYVDTDPPPPPPDFGVPDGGPPDLTTDSTPVDGPPIPDISPDFYLPDATSDSLPPFDLGPDSQPPPQLADLEVTTMAHKTTEDAVYYAVQVCNNGPGDAGGFYVDLYHDRDSAPSVNIYGDQYQYQSGLPAGACVNLDFSWQQVKPGTYSSWAQADADGVVNETNEGNNVFGPDEVEIKIKPPPPPPGGPDLTITFAQATVQGGTNQVVVYEAKICNNGDQDSGETEIHVYYDLPTPPAPGQTGDAFLPVPGLLPGQCVPGQLARPGTQPGTYQSYAQIDPFNVIPEVVEDNNVYGPLTVTVGTTAGADLTIASFTAQQNPGTSTIQYSLELCNQGTGVAGPSAVHVYYDRVGAPSQGELGDQATNVPQLAAGACVVAVLQRYGTPDGTYTSWAQIDASNAIAELDEGNNTAGPAEVTVGTTTGLPDIVISDFGAKVGGNSVYYWTTVCNQGTANAGAFRVDLYYHQLTPPTSPGNQQQWVPALAVGDCTTLNYTWNGAANGSYVSWLRADVTNLAPELDESNNLGGPRTVVVGSAPLNCTALCSFAIQCGVFQPQDLLQCANWCTGLTLSQRACLGNAVQGNDCAAFSACDTPPPPPPPPPPGTCATICDHLIDTCNLLPSNQYWTCMGACQTQPKDKVDCATNAVKQGQCMQTITCLF